MGNAKIGDYLMLMKPRVMSLVVFTAIVGMVLAPDALAPPLAGLAVLGIALGAGACGALNMWYDRDIDRVMARTAWRPIPMGRVTPASALCFGVLLALGSVTLLGLATNWLASALLGLTIAYYLFVYTAWLKRRTSQSVVIGGVAGALPPVVGWAACTGEIGLPAVILFAIIFFWTPPHSWALALFRGTDFAKAELPLLRADNQDTAAKKQIFAYSIILLPVTVMPYFTNNAGFGYLIAASVLGALFVLAAWRLLQATVRDTDKRARDLFTYSIGYLFFLFLALLTDHAVAGLIGQYSRPV